jgi:porphobilinogen deaminase
MMVLMKSEKSHRVCAPVLQLAHRVATISEHRRKQMINAIRRMLVIEPLRPLVFGALARLQHTSTDAPIEHFVLQESGSP